MRELLNTSEFERVRGYAALMIEPDGYKNISAATFEEYVTRPELASPSNSDLASTYSMAAAALKTPGKNHEGAKIVMAVIEGQIMKRVRPLQHTLFG